MRCRPRVPTMTAHPPLFPSPSPRNRRRAFVLRAERLRKRRATTPRRGGKPSRTSRPPLALDLDSFEAKSNCTLSAKARNPRRTARYLHSRDASPAKTSLTCRAALVQEALPPPPSHLSPSLRLENQTGELPDTPPDLYTTPLDGRRVGDENGGGGAGAPSRIPPPLIASLSLSCALHPTSSVCYVAGNASWSVDWRRRELARRR